MLCHPNINSLEEKIENIKISVVVPVYNERHTIEELLDRIINVKINKEIIIVDDGSKDGTLEIIKKYIQPFPFIKLIIHKKNRGKGAALRSGFTKVTGHIVIIQDADLEYDPFDYYKLIVPILEKRADVVYGSRFLGGNQKGLFFRHYVANKILTTLSNIFTNNNLSDMTTCFKVFPADVIKKIPLKSNRFGFEPEFTAKVAKQKLRIHEVSISYHGRNYDQGKKIGWKDGLNMLWCVFRYNLFG